MKKNKYLDSEIIEYKNYAFEKDLLYIRPVLLISGLLYGAFGIADYFFYPQYLGLFLGVRFFLVVPLILLGFLYTYHSSYKKYYQPVITFLMFVSGFAIVIMVCSIEGDNYYFSGVSLVISVAFLLLRIKTIYALMCSLAIVLSFILIGHFYSGFAWIEILAITMFYLAFIFVGAVGSRYIAYFRKNQYYHDILIESEKVVLEKKVYQQYENLKNYHYSMIYALATMVESRDNLTGNHVKRVGRLSYLLAQALPDDIFKKENIVKKDFLDTIQLASVLHDIGKIAISDTILNKPGKLSDKEFEIIKTHTTMGYKMLQTIKLDSNDNPFINLGAQIAKSHHERWDGRGYPEGLAQGNIPLSARIVAIIDVYDALLSKRSYKEAFSKEKSIAIIKEGHGTQFDPLILDAFIDLLEHSSDEELFE